MKRLLLAALAALAGAGCSSSASSAPSASCAPPACPIAPMALAAKITPPSTRTDITRLDVGTVTLDASGFFTVTLERPILISGKVSVGQIGKGKLTGTVVATRPSRIVGRPDESYQTTLDGSGNYSLAVTETLPGESYTLRVLSTDTSLYPPQTFQLSDVTVPAGTPRQIGFDLVLDDPAQLQPVKGVVTDAVGAPIAGLQVQALDPNNKSVASTTATTDATGSYSVLLSKSTAKLMPPVVALVVTPTMNAPVGTPSLEKRIDLTHVDGNLRAPPLPATAQFTYPVMGVGSSGAAAPAVGAQVQFKATVTNPNAPEVTALFQASGQTDADGNVSLMLIPGQGSRDYIVTVAPPSISDLQGLVTTVSVGPSGGYGAPIALRLRPQLSGRVTDMLGLPVRSLTVQPGPATVASALDATSLAGVVRVDSALTNGDGRFALRVDTGTYDVALLPPASMHLARQWLDRVLVDGDKDVGDVTVPPAATARVLVLDADGNPLPAASVQLYSLALGNLATTCRTVDCLSPPRLAAEGTTGTDGSVPLLLPSQSTNLAPGF